MDVTYAHACFPVSLTTNQIRTGSGLSSSLKNQCHFVVDTQRIILWQYEWQSTLLSLTRRTHRAFAL
jgi:hypothetical protein